MIHLRAARARALLACLPVAAACGDRSAARSELQEELDRLARRQELRTQFASVQAQLRPVQAQALDSPSVRAAQAAFYDILRRRMSEIDAGSVALLERAAVVGEDLSRAAGSPVATPEEKQRVARELQTVERLLRPIQDSALRDPTVAASFRLLQDSVVATITRIDPSARALIDRMRTIEGQIASLDSAGGDGEAGAGRVAPALPKGGAEPEREGEETGSGTGATRPGSGGDG